MVFSLSTEERIAAAESGLTCIEDEIIIAALDLNIDPWAMPDDWHSDDIEHQVLNLFMQRRRIAEEWLNKIKQG